MIHFCSGALLLFSYIQVETHELFWLYVLQAIAEPLLGFANGVIYGIETEKAFLIKLGWYDIAFLFGARFKLYELLCVY